MTLSSSIAGEQLGGGAGRQHPDDQDPARRRRGAEPLPAGDGTRGFVPVAEIYIGELAQRCVHEVKADYPPRRSSWASRAAVVLRLGIDRKGTSTR